MNHNSHHHKKDHHKCACGNLNKESSIILGYLNARPSLVALWGGGIGGGRMSLGTHFEVSRLMSS